MRRVAFLLLALVVGAGFTHRPADHEQIVFDYFVLQVLPTDFPHILSFEFKGKTEPGFATLGKSKVCLSPVDRLGEILKKTTRNARKNMHEREVETRHIEEIVIAGFEPKTKRPKLLLYPALHVADHYYVFVRFQAEQREHARYLFELTPEGRILRSCRMD